MSNQPRPQGAAFGPSHQIEMKEKHRELMNDLAVRRAQQPRPMIGDDNAASTYQNFAQSDASLENQGRFAKAQHISGTQPTTQYPRLPSGPWSGPDPSGLEPPLGIDVSEAPIVGEPFEVEASLRAFPLGLRGNATHPCHRRMMAQRRVRHSFFLLSLDPPTLLGNESSDARHVASVRLQRLEGADHRWRVQVRAAYSFASDERLATGWICNWRAQRHRCA
jgi:hypothetical protein